MARSRAAGLVGRPTTYIGFALGAMLSLALMLGASLVLAPQQIEVDTLSQVALPTAAVVGNEIILTGGYFNGLRAETWSAV